MDYLKIAVLNNSGNVGKTTITNYLLSPRIDNSHIVRIETINDNGGDQSISARDMTKVINEIDAHNKVIVDVGSSNIENLILGMRKNIGSHEDIDFYIIPTTPDHKQQRDTSNTIDSLLDLGVEPQYISVLLNRVDDKIGIDDQFTVLSSLSCLEKTATKTLSTCPIIPNSEVFNLLNELDADYFDLLNDTTDYKTKIREAKSARYRSELSLKKSCSRLIKGFDQQLDIAFLKLKKSLKIE